jgi:hypothetical protein
MGFGIDDDYTSEYIEYLKTREYAITRWKNSQYSEEKVKAMENQNVQVVLDFGIDGIDAEKLNRNYKQV